MKKKILLMTPNLGGGGAERVLIDLLQLLDKEKYDITLCTLFREGVYLDNLPEFVKHCSIINKPNKIKKAIFWRILKYCPPKLVYKFLIREKYDTEIAFQEGLSTILLSGSSCKNKIVWVHCDLLNFNWVSFYYRSDKHQSDTYQAYQKIVFVSQQAKSSFQQKFGTFGTETVIYNLIDTTAVLEKSEEMIPETHLTVPVVCAVGRLVPVKGFMRLLSVHKRLMEEGILHQLWICGAGSDLEQMQNFIRENQLEKSVVLWGFQKNPYPFVKKANIFVSSSFVEGYPLSVLEALVLEKPIIATWCTGPVEILDNGNFGFLVENSEEGLYGGIRKLLTDNVLLEEVREKAILGAKQFDLNHILHQVEELL